jgi:acyl-CoA synthetase (AMP-forming)/AMP-acid ligase II
MKAESLEQTYDRLSQSTVWEELERTAGRLPDKVALVDGDTRLTFAEVKAGAEQVAAGLAALGIGRGDIVAVYVPNSAELCTLFYGLQRLGAVIAWINPNYRESEVRFILENSGARALFLFESWNGYNCLEAVLGMDGLPDLGHLVLVRGAEGAGEGDSRLRRFEELQAGSAPLPPPTTAPGDLSMLIYTSGTTSRPKGAMIRQSQVVRAGFSYSLGVNATEDDVFIGFLPMSHSYGCGALLLQPFILGATLVLLSNFSPEAAFALIEKEKVTLQLAAPAHYILELNHPKRAEYDLSSLRAGLTAGQLAPAGLITRVQEEMGVHIASFLGSSEVGPGLSIILPFPSTLEVRERSIGYALHGTEARVADPATGEELPDGESGELVLRGWHVTEGYWKNHEETQNQIRDGWLHTGDLVMRDEDGSFRILGRLKDCINRGGFKVIPSELEALIVEHPGVAEVCVVGTPNPVLGESICACIVADASGGEIKLEEVRRQLETRVAPFKLPDELLMLSELPRMPGGVKVNRFGQGGVTELAANAQDKQTTSR